MRHRPRLGTERRRRGRPVTDPARRAVSGRAVGGLGRAELVGYVFDHRVQAQSRWDKAPHVQCRGRGLHVGGGGHERPCHEVYTERVALHRSAVCVHMTNSLQARRQVIGWQPTEPRAFVVRSIPGDVRERRESYCFQTVAQGPLAGIPTEAICEYRVGWSTAASNTSAAPPSDSATWPITSPDHYSRPRIQSNFTLCRL